MHAIYLGLLLPIISCVLPSGLGEQPSNAGLHGLTTHKAYGPPVSPPAPAGSYPAFSPLPPPLTPPKEGNTPLPCGEGQEERWRLFSVTLLCLCRQLPVRKYGALRCPDFPLHTTMQRHADLLSMQRYDFFGREKNW